MSNTIKVIIADDELLAREAIRLRLEGVKGFDVIAEADNGNDATLLTASLRPNVLFLDINMPKKSGIEVSECIKEYSGTLVVFVTAYEQFALQAFRQNAVDYITKPIDDDEFSRVIEKIRKRHLEQVQLQKAQALFAAQPKEVWLKRISIKDGSEVRMFSTDEIESVTSVKDYLCITIDGKVYIHRLTMQKMESQLNPQLFIRCHRSHLVNKLFVQKWKKTNGQELLVCRSGEHPVSRRYKSVVKQALS